MAVKDRVSEQAFIDLTVADPDTRWELHGGLPREKPPMSWEHGDVVALMSYLLQHQLDRAEYRVRINEGRVRRSADRYYIPDLIVLPAALAAIFAGKPGSVPIFRDPLPLVIEAWSPSTGGYDVRAKLAEYQARGDAEIWYLHPYDRTLTAWRRTNGTYTETTYREGIVRPASLPGVAIDLAVLFGA